MSIAWLVALAITACLSPGKWKILEIVFAGVAAAIHTVPTGFPGTAPPGPAIPEVAIAQSVPRILQAPVAICSTTCWLTAPYFSKSIDETPNMLCFTVLQYATIDPLKISEQPAIAVIEEAIEPPVQLSAVPTVYPVFLSTARTNSDTDSSPCAIVNGSIISKRF